MFICRITAITKPGKMHSVIRAKSVKVFEGRLDRHWNEHPLVYDYNIPYNTCYTVHSKLKYEEIEEPNIEEQADSCVRKRLR